MNPAELVRQLEGEQVGRPAVDRRALAQVLLEKARVIREMAERRGREMKRGEGRPESPNEGGGGTGARGGGVDPVRDGTRGEVNGILTPEGERGRDAGTPSVALAA
jgi:hypothetical protein